MILQLHVHAGARENSVEKLDDTHYKVKVTAPAEKGKANEAVIETLAAYFKVKKHQVKILSGFTCPVKFVEILK